MRALIVGSGVAVATLMAVCAASVPALSGESPHGVPAGTLSTPNILFIILDDVGIDQLSIFNTTAPPDVPFPDTPNIDAIATAGVKFTDFWSMPECSPARASFFTGRYPLRNGVTNIILDNDLPAGQVSPYETTVPKMLQTAGYTSSLIGKFHLGNDNPAGNSSPAALGWAFYNGILAGVPPDIDTTLGGQIDDSDVYSCGFPAGPLPGACWFQTEGGGIVCEDGDLTGLDCLTMGGIPALKDDGQPAALCAEAAGPPDFSVVNGYYVWPKDIVTGALGASSGNAVTSISREYMTIDHTDASIQWIQQQAGSPRPWMCTVSYNSDHTPYQQPPTSLTPESADYEDCADEITKRAISDLMIEAMDTEIGRLLVSTGLATRDGDGLDLTLEATNTAIIVVGDNGSFFPVVKAPYNPARAKGTCYQTGVMCPLIVAGPSAIVTGPDRSVDHMVNGVDLFQLFGEIAGVNVRDVVPASHILDSESVLPYLQNPEQPSIRQYNFAQLGLGVPDPSTSAGPCVLFDGAACDDILFISQALCEANGGVWYGEPDAGGAQGGDGDMVFSTCCELQASGQAPPGMAVIPRKVWTIRNESYKLLMFDQACCERGDQCPDGEFRNTYEFYPLQDDPALDNATDNLLLVLGACDIEAQLTPDEYLNFLDLQQALDELLASEIQCNGDGNLDKQVNEQDLLGVMKNFGVPSVFDLNADGTTDDLDMDCVLENMGNVCTADDAGATCVGTLGACCLGDGTCTTMTESECLAAQGGVYQGDGTTQCCAAPCADP